MLIAEKISALRKEIPPDVKIIAVSKTRPVPDIKEAYNASQRIFGENRVQELLQKHPLLPDDIEWHLIGHLQTNKVKYIAPFVKMIHSVDSLKLLVEIDKEAAKAGRVIDCLLEMRIAREETKFGLLFSDAGSILESPEFNNLRNTKICGVMGIATFTSDLGIVKAEFQLLQRCFNELKTAYFRDDYSFKELSMGMSGDYKLAIEEGSTMIRIGTLIFGERN